MESPKFPSTMPAWCLPFNLWIAAVGALAVSADPWISDGRLVPGLAIMGLSAYGILSESLTRSEPDTKASTMVSHSFIYVLTVTHAASLAAFFLGLLYMVYLSISWQMSFAIIGIPLLMVMAMSGYIGGIIGAAMGLNALPKPISRFQMMIFHYCAFLPSASYFFFQINGIASDHLP